MWLDRLLIDARYQGRGYGKAALRGLIRQFFAEGHGAVYLSLYADNAAALKLYQAHGFVFTGELDTKGERIMRLTRDRASLARRGCLTDAGYPAGRRKIGRAAALAAALLAL